MSEKSKAIERVAEGLTNDFENWINDLEDKKQPAACNIHDESCEECSG